ncbi:MAG: flagellin [Phycisphaerales bacterium]|nr:flagellin [Phycisphaerales bacterium]
MARINSNISSLIAQRNLAQSNTDLATSLERLSTGLQINGGADNPAGLIISERLRSELNGMNQAVNNSERASSVIATTEGYLSEISDLLNSVKGLVTEAANTGGVSLDEIKANQMQIDDAIDSITRISNTASFAGLQLLNGSMSYMTSGISNSDIDAVQVWSAQFGNADQVPVSVEVVTAAEQASLFLSGTTSEGNPPAGILLSTVTLEIAGNTGVQSLTFVSGTTYDDIANAINTLSESTGVQASLFNVADASSGLTFTSTGYGDDQFVSVRPIGQGGETWQTHLAKAADPLNPTAGEAQATERDEGVNVGAIVNGALAVGTGLELALNTTGLTLDMVLTETFATTVSGTSSDFSLTGGGVNFQLGPTISESQRVGLGIPSVAASRLGGTVLEGVRYCLDSLRTGGDNSLVAGASANASSILESAINEVAQLRGRLGAFERNTIDTSIRSLQIGIENITASESRIRDTDFAKETAALTRAQILAQAGTSVLATANAQAQNVLALLS